MLSPRPAVSRGTRTRLPYIMRESARQWVSARSSRTTASASARSRNSGTYVTSPWSPTRRVGLAAEANKAVWRGMRVYERMFGLDGGAPFDELRVTKAYLTAAVVFVGRRACGGSRRRDRNGVAGGFRRSPATAFGRGRSSAAKTSSERERSQ